MRGLCAAALTALAACTNGDEVIASEMFHLTLQRTGGKNEYTLRWYTDGFAEPVSSVSTADINCETGTILILSKDGKRYAEPQNIGYGGDRTFVTDEILAAACREDDEGKTR